MAGYSLFDSPYWGVPNRLQWNPRAPIGSQVLIGNPELRKKKKKKKKVRGAKGLEPGGVESPGRVSYHRSPDTRGQRALYGVPQGGPVVAGQHWPPTGDEAIGYSPSGRVNYHDGELIKGGDGSTNSAMGWGGLLKGPSMNDITNLATGGRKPVSGTSVFGVPSGPIKDPDYYPRPGAGLPMLEPGGVEPPLTKYGTLREKYSGRRNPTSQEAIFNQDAAVKGQALYGVDIVDDGVVVDGSADRDYYKTYHASEFDQTGLPPVLPDTAASDDGSTASATISEDTPPVRVSPNSFSDSPLSSAGPTGNIGDLPVEEVAEGSLPSLQRGRIMGYNSIEEFLAHLKKADKKITPVMREKAQKLLGIDPEKASKIRDWNDVTNAIPDYLKEWIPDYLRNPGAKLDNDPVKNAEKQENVAELWKGVFTTNPLTAAFGKGGLFAGYADDKPEGYKAAPATETLAEAAGAGDSKETSAIAETVAKQTGGDAKEIKEVLSSDPSRIWGDYRMSGGSQKQKYLNALNSMYQKAMILNVVAALTGSESQAGLFLEMASKKFEAMQGFDGLDRLENIRRGVFYTKDGNFDPPKSREEAFKRAVQFGASPAEATKLSGWAASEKATKTYGGVKAEHLAILKQMRKDKDPMADAFARIIGAERKNLRMTMAQLGDYRQDIEDGEGAFAGMSKEARNAALAEVDEIRTRMMKEMKGMGLSSVTGNPAAVPSAGEASAPRFATGAEAQTAMDGGSLNSGDVFYIVVDGVPKRYKVD